jgi:hypothetical protein
VFGVVGNQGLASGNLEGNEGRDVGHWALGDLGRSVECVADVAVRGGPGEDGR